MSDAPGGKISGTEQLQGPGPSYDACVDPPSQASLSGCDAGQMHAGR